MNWSQLVAGFLNWFAFVTALKLKMAMIAVNSTIMTMSIFRTVGVVKRLRLATTLGGA